MQLIIGTSSDCGALMSPLREDAHALFPHTTGWQRCFNKIRLYRTTTANTSSYVHLTKCFNKPKQLRLDFNTWLQTLLSSMFFLFFNSYCSCRCACGVCGQVLHTNVERTAIRFRISSIQYTQHRRSLCVVFIVD